jgi:hypothetical protein
VLSGPKHFVYLPGGIQRDEAKIKAVAQATGLSAYEAKVMLGAPGPRKIGAFVKEEDAQGQALALRQAGLTAFVIDKERFSRAPRIFKARKAIETPEGLVFTVETAPAPGEIEARVFELPHPKGMVSAVLMGYTTQTTTHSDGAKSKIQTSSTQHAREVFIHLYTEDPHTILEISGLKVQLPWADKLAGVYGEFRWQKLAEMLAAYYKAKLDVTLFKFPDEVRAITAALNVDETRGSSGKGAAGSSSSMDDAPVAQAASRIIVYSLVFGL